MNALFVWCLYILAGYSFAAILLVAAGFLIGLLTRGVWRRTRGLIDRALDDNDDGGDLTALLDAIREDPDAATQEIDMSELRAAHPVYVGRRRREHRPSYINGEDSR